MSGRSSFVIGHGPLARGCVEQLMERGHPVVGILTSDASFADWAKSQSLMCVTWAQAARLKHGPSHELLFNIVSCRRIPTSIASATTHSKINYHDSLLPSHAGYHSTTWAILDGEQRHGVTWHLLQGPIDSGDILVQRDVAITDGDTAFTLNTACFEAACSSFGELLDHLESGATQPSPQDISRRTFAALQQRPPAAGIIDWQWPAVRIERLVRSLTFGPTANPLATAKALLGEDLLRVEHVTLSRTRSLQPPGTIVAGTGLAWRVATGDFDIDVKLSPIVTSARTLPTAVASDVIGRQFHNMDASQSAQVRATYEASAPVERRWVERIKTMLSHRRDDSRPTTPSTRRHGIAWTIDEAIAQVAQRNGWDIRAAILTAWSAVVRRCTSASSTELWLSDEPQRRAAADSAGALADILGSHLECDATFCVSNAIAATTWTLRELSTSRPHAADIVDRYPSLRALAARRPAPAAVIGCREQDLPAFCEQRDVVLIEQTAGVTYEWSFDADRWPAEQAELMVSRATAWLAAAVADPGGLVGGLPVVGVGDLRLFEEVNDTAVAVADVCLHDLVGLQVERSPDAVAVEHEGRLLTYRQVDELAEVWSSRLRAAGVGVGDLVAVCVPRTPGLVVALLAVLKSGAAYVPLDPGYPVDRLRFMIDDSRPAVVLAEGGSADWLAGSGPPVWLLDAGDEEFAGGLGSGGDEQVAATVEDLAYVIYTSGSTGRPKGVMINHKAAVNHMTWMQATFPLDHTDIVVQKTPTTFDASVWEFFAPLVAGARILLAPAHAHHDPDILLDVIEQSHATVLQVVPTLLRALLAEDRLTRCVSLRRVFCGGEPLAAALSRRFADVLPATALVNLYGPTESTIDATCWIVPPHAADDPPPIGLPVANTSVFVLDEAGRQVPVGVAGELWIGGLGLARGYLNRPELTAQRFVTGLLPDQPGMRLYRTGDLVTMRADGNLVFHGRLDDQVKIRGHRIEPAEIEAVLAMHSLVQSAAVASYLDDSGERRLGAYVVAPLAGADLPVQVRRHVRARMPEAMVPTAVIVLDALPLTPNGKLDRKALAPPTPAQSRHAVPAAGSVTPVEQALAAIWQDVLRLDNVNPDDNFLDLGGDSLDLMRARACIQARFGVRLSIADLFQHSTLRQQTTRLQQLVPGQPSPPPGAAVIKPRHKQTKRSGTSGAIAIVGIACRLPGAANANEFWNRLVAGDEMIGPLPKSAPIDVQRPGAAYVHTYGPIADFDQFDASFFGYSAREAETLDPQHRVFLELSWHALEDAGVDPARAQAPIGVFAGSGHSGYLLHHVMPHRRRLDPAGDLRPLLGGSLDALHVLIANDKDFLAPRLSYRLDLTGPSITVQTGCSTSLVAVHLAAQSLRLDECGIAVAGGVSIRLPGNEGYWSEPGGITSPDGHCRPFDANASGTVFTSGAGVVVLKRLDDAMRDRDQIYAVIRGSAVNNDGSSKIGFSAPSVQGHADAIRRALNDADIEAASIGYIEAHGTGTALGDPVEIAAFTAVFADGQPRSEPCMIGSVKGNIGHCDAAAGIASLIKTALVVRTGTVPPSINFTQPHDEIDFSATPFTIATGRSRWPHGPRRAGVSSLGVGGTNAHLILEQPPSSQPSPQRPQGVELFIASAPSARQLRRIVRDAQHLTGAAQSTAQADMAHTLRVGRRQFNHRAYWLSDGEHASEPVLRQAVSTASPSVAFLFPGQGTEYAGMGRHLYDHEPAYRLAFDECASIAGQLGLDLADIIAERAKVSQQSPLASTQFAQPALFAVMYALASTLRSWGLKPAAMVGHSLGEIVAATIAGVFRLEDALRFVAARGAAMAACPPGAMLAVRAPASQVRAILPAGLTVAAINSATDTVVAGDEAAVAIFAQRCHQRGWPALRLPSNRAFHSPGVHDAVAVLEAVLADMTLMAPGLRIISTVTGAPLGEEAQDASYWMQQARQPVLFGHALDEVLAQHCDVAVECGPGSVLTGLARRRAQTRIATAAPLPDRRGARAGERSSALDALGRLWLAGVAIDWDQVGLLGRPAKTSAPLYPFERRRHWLEPVATQPELPAAVAETGAAAVRIPGWSRRHVWPPLASEIDGNCLVAYLDPGNALGAQLLNELAGTAAILIRPGTVFTQVAHDEFAIDPQSEDDHWKLFNTLASAGRIPSRMIYGWPATVSASSQTADVDPGAWGRSLLLAYRGWRHAYPSAATSIDVIGRGAYAVTGTEAIHPPSALIAGLAAVIGQEDLQADVTYLDLDLVLPPGAPGLTQRGRILDVILTPRPRSAALRGRHLWTPEYRQVTLAEPTPANEPKTWVILGGLGAIGLTLAEHLASTESVRLILAGRTAPILGDALSRRDATSQALSRIVATGTPVLTAHVDVRDQQSLHSLFNAVEQQFGRIAYVAHVAGITGAAAAVPVSELDWRTAEHIMSPKTAGVTALDGVLAGRDIERCILFSSSSAVLGGVGLGAYAAANAYLDAFAQGKHHAGDDRWLSINWDAWAGTAAASEHESATGIAPAAAFDALTKLRDLRHVAQALVVTPSFDSRHAIWMTASRSSRTAGQQPTGVSQADELTDVPGGGGGTGPATATDDVLNQLSAIWVDVLGHHDIGPFDEFRDLGGDSLAATRVAARMRRQFRVDVPLRKVLKARTLTDLTSIVHAALAVTVDTGSQPSNDPSHR